MKFCDLIIFAGCLGAATSSSALSLGASQGSVLLGSNVDLVFQIQADPGYTAESSCVRAEVWMGDVRLGSSQVQLQAISDSSMRLRTLQTVNEPLINVKLTAGCTGAISRSYPFFADPPVSMAASIEPIDLSSIQVARLPPATAAFTASTVSSTAAAVRATPKPKPKVAKREVKPQPAPSAQPLTPAPTATASGNGGATASVAAQAAVESATEQPKLRMQALDGLVEASTPAASDTTLSTDTDGENSPFTIASTIDASTQLLLDTNAQRLELLEQQLQAMQSTLNSNRTEINNLQSQLVQAESEGLPLWVHLMLGMLALALAAIAWLLQRIKQERAQAESRWADTVLAAQDNLPVSATPSFVAPVTSQPIQQVPVTTPAPTDGSQTSALSSSAPMAGQPSTLAPVPAVTEGDLSLAHWLEAGGQPDALPSPAVTVPEATTTEQAQASWNDVQTAQALFGIQEQAEFYASVGEHDQAILLLQEHIAQNEASSPLAYLELLQLLYRLSRTEDFEQVSTQFQRHFNVQVPSFLRFARKGHDLWSSHPEVLSEIEALWPTDNVLPLLRKLIVANPQAPHPETDIRFDLAAFDDLLMLYNVAQTTPAATRGAIAGRNRTAPLVTPLPEVTQEDSALGAHSEFLPNNVFFKNSMLHASIEPTPSVTPELPPLQTASLELLSPAAAPAPLSTPAPVHHSPLQSSSHFSNAEVLMDGLAIEWDHGDTPVAAAPASTLSRPDFALSDPLSNAGLLNDPLLSAPLLSETDLGELQLDSLMVDERDLPSGVVPGSSQAPR